MIPFLKNLHMINQPLNYIYVMKEKKKKHEKEREYIPYSPCVFIWGSRIPSRRDFFFMKLAEENLVYFAACHYQSYVTRTQRYITIKTNKYDSYIFFLFVF